MRTVRLLSFLSFFRLLKLRPSGDRKCVLVGGGAQFMWLKWKRVLCLMQLDLYYEGGFACGSGIGDAIYSFKLFA